jgi:MraZ protein
MSQEGFFSGAALAALDDKGRIALPAAFRKFLPTGSSARQLFVTTHEEAPCLVGSGLDRIARIQARIDRSEDLAAQQGKEFDRFALERRLVGPGETVPMDGSGRFSLSDVLVELAEFEGEIFLFGAGQYFEIWDLARLLAMTEPGYAAAQAAARAAMRVRDKQAAKKASGQ